MNEIKQVENHKDKQDRSNTTFGLAWLVLATLFLRFLKKDFERCSLSKCRIKYVSGYYCVSVSVSYVIYTLHIS